MRAEPVVTPLGLPDTLVHLIDTTLEEIFLRLKDSPRRQRPDGRGAEQNQRPLCPCSHNPFLAYFTAAKQALREGLILAQTACAPLDPLERDSSLLELDSVFHQITKRDIEAFCGLCQFRHLSLPAPAQTLAIQEG